MFIRLLVISIFLVVVVQSTVTNSSKGQIVDALTLPKQAPSLYDDYDLNDQTSLGTNAEGSGGAASIDEYADDEEEEQLSKVTATTTTVSSSTSTMGTTTRITTTTAPTTTKRTTSTTTTALNKWTKTTFNYEQPKKKTQSSTTTTVSSAFNDLDASEFKDEHEEYADDLEDDAYYNEPTVSNKVSTVSISSPRYPIPTTRPSLAVNHTAPIWVLFSFLTRPPIAAGILAGKSFQHRKKTYLFEFLQVY